MFIVVDCLSVGKTIINLDGIARVENGTDDWAYGNGYLCIGMFGNWSVRVSLKEFNDKILPNLHGIGNLSISVESQTAMDSSQEKAKLDISTGRIVHPSNTSEIEKTKSKDYGW
jgi:hypothetical protein